MNNDAGQSVARRCAPRISENAGKAEGTGDEGGGGKGGSDGSNLFGSEIQVRLTLRRCVGKLLRCHFERASIEQVSRNEILISGRKLNPLCEMMIKKTETAMSDIILRIIRSRAIDMKSVYNRPYSLSAQRIAKL